MPYQDTAKQIIKDSIKSAVFIDEKARSFFVNESIPANRIEEELSVSLYENFKINGISLEIHKFRPRDLDDTDLKQFLFKARDLVLLDWKLDDQEGEEYSLKLLSEIINQPHIHFCSIYTSVDNLDDVFWNILSYFSDHSEEQYDEIRFNLADLEDEIIALIPQIRTISERRFDRLSRRDFINFCRTNEPVVTRIKEEVEGSDLCAVVRAGIAFSEEFKSNTPLPCPSIISPTRRTLTIGNTIVTILNKGDNNANSLIENFSNQISSSDQSFIQLLGLEMQQLLSAKTAFVDTNILQASKEAFLFHRTQKGKDGFNDFIKEVLFEQARLHLRQGKLMLLDETLLDRLGDNSRPLTDQNEILAINTFYNSIVLNGNRSINFGDVFKYEDKYFLCITALCDCLTPKKNQFYFAEGKIINKSKALPLGDTAFVSYLPDVIVRWSDDQREAGAIFKPIYIKPISFTIPNKNIESGKLNLFSLSEAGERNEMEIEYVTTIKQNYTQRIANHAFTHPVRVGVDFIKN